MTVQNLKDIHKQIFKTQNQIENYQEKEDDDIKIQHETQMKMKQIKKILENKESNLDAIRTNIFENLDVLK